jgi:hypothetical protein
MFLGNVEEKAGDGQKLAKLKTLLVQTRTEDVAASLPRTLTLDRAIPPAGAVQIEAIGADAPKFRVFRRETSVVSPLLDLSRPAWARGGLATQSVGPFTSADGRQFWYDFFPIANLVQLFVEGDDTPAMLFAEGKQSIVNLITHRITLGSSSVWIRADLLDSGAAAGGYVGLSIQSGVLQFNKAPTANGNTLTMPLGSHCDADLQLKPSPAPPAAPGQAGIDAADSTLNTPAEVAFRLAADSIALKKVTDAGWKLFGESLNLTWDPATPPSSELNGVVILIPYKPEGRKTGVAAAQSPLTKPAGTAPIQAAGWILPVTVIDVSVPPDAADNGGFAVHAGAGMTIGWRGLRDGPVSLPAPWIALFSGVIVILEPKASNLYAHQRFLLWKDASSRFRSELDLQYSDSFTVTYVSMAEGQEALITQAAVDGHLDRPVDVKGTPFAVRTRASAVALSYSDPVQRVFVIDDHVPVDPSKPVAVALRNALFTTTTVGSLFMFGDLVDEENVGTGSLILGMGLAGLLPTLPDPYAAATGVTHTMRDQLQPWMTLLGTVKWTPAQADLGFVFAPLAQQQAVAILSRPLANQTAIQPEDIQFARFGNLQPNQPDWDRDFAGFDIEQFRLVDVSSNADQMGVSFAYFADRELAFHTLYKAAPVPSFPLQVEGLDLSAQSRFVRAFALPQISWEPLVNLSKPVLADDPRGGWNLYPDDGGPLRLGNDSVQLVPIEPIPVTEFYVQDFTDRKGGISWALFTLPFGLRAFAQFNRENQFTSTLPGTRLGLFRPEYQTGTLVGALQVRADAPPHPPASPTFPGATLQLNNVLDVSGSPTLATTLGHDVATIFNFEFFYKSPTPIKLIGVPLSRIDFCGYGASVFSHWQDPKAVIAATSKAYFDVFKGRTAEEVIQVRSLIYPWGIRVVRTITMTRAADGYVFRYDTGWQAESDGIYDFSTPDLDNPYEFHPGLVKGVFQVRNIQDAPNVAPFKQIWNKKNGDPYLDPLGNVQRVGPATPPEFLTDQVDLQPVYFDADVQIDYLVSGATNGRVPSKGMLGYVQLSPQGVPISPDLFAQLLGVQFGALGGPVDCVIDAAKSGQKIRIGRVDVNASTDGVKPIFVSAARGPVVFPKEGSWSLTQHNQGTGEVSPLDPQTAVPIIRRGKLSPNATTTDTTPGDLIRIANPVDLVQPLTAASLNYGFLQSTHTQKALFRLPAFQEGVAELKSAAQEVADAYRLVNTKGIFPNVQDAVSLTLGAFKTSIIPEGFKLVNPAAPGAVFQQAIPNSPLYLINESFLKIYIEYSNNNDSLKYSFDSSAAAYADQWLTLLSNVNMVVDLGPLPRLATITGFFDTAKGKDPAFATPQLKLSDALEKVKDILQILEDLQGGDYAAAFGKGLEIAMSNSADSWNYALHAAQEIPVVRFPPGALYDNPTNPFKIEAHLSLGLYFNEAISIPSAPAQLIPSAGAFIEFGGSLSVLCVSLAVAAVYAVGSVDLRIAADIKTGPSLHMKFGFGAEVVVSLPVIATVSVLYMVHIEVDLDTGSLAVNASLLFRGRAEILDGIVTVQIQIEASGTYKRILGPPDHTDLTAQVTFGLDISIFLVINLHFSKSWSETRQIA